jgi:hypothetical protein
MAVISDAEILFTEMVGKPAHLRFESFDTFTEFKGLHATLGVGQFWQGQLRMESRVLGLGGKFVFEPSLQPGNPRQSQSSPTSIYHEKKKSCGETMWIEAC